MKTKGFNNNCPSNGADKFARISRICYSPKWIYNCLTRRLVISLRRSIVLGMLYFLLIFSFMSTVGFWTILSEIRTENRLAPELTGNTETKRQLRSLRDWMEFPEIDLDTFNAADMFILKPAAETAEGVGGSETRMILETKDMQQQVGTCTKATTVCPEFDIPDLVKERIVNMSDVPIEEVEKILLGDRLLDVRRLVEKTNNLINKTRVAANTSFVSCEATTSRDRCGNMNYRKALESTRILADNYMYTPGGIWTPKDCLPRWKVAIIFPYRNRSFHLPIVIRFLTPMLQRQKLEFGFYVTEQANNLNFNRAMLMNVGFLEALNFSKWDCFIFHDVDHIPISDYNYYGCSGMPRHFLSGADRWKYKLPYQDFFGAVTGLSRGQIFDINGFPNVYWGWGGEDDEILSRVRAAGLDISRIKGPNGYHNVIKHHHQSAPQMKERFQLLRNFKPRLKKDGLNNLRYSKPEVTLHVLYTNISVDIQKLKVDVPLAKNVINPKPKRPVPRPHVKPVQKSKVLNQRNTGGNAEKPQGANRNPVIKQEILKPQRADIMTNNSKTANVETHDVKTAVVVQREGQQQQQQQPENIAPGVNINNLKPQIKSELKDTLIANRSGNGNR